MDSDGSGEIGVQELQEPMIGLGFADSVENVKEMIATVDKDGGNGKIEFPEFL